MVSLVLLLLRGFVISSAFFTVVVVGAGYEPHGDTSYYSRAQHLIDVTKSKNVYHVDLHARGSRDKVPWLAEFPRKELGLAAAATVSHPIRRMLAHLRAEGLELEEAMTWGSGEGAHYCCCRIGCLILHFTTLQCVWCRRVIKWRLRGLKVSVAPSADHACGHSGVSLNIAKVATVSQRAYLRNPSSVPLSRTHIRKRHFEKCRAAKAAINNSEAKLLFVVGTGCCCVMIQSLAYDGRRFW